MNAEEIAERLTGMEYRSRIPKDVLVAAKAAGLVVVYGASDDLMEFDGAISDEVGAGTVRVDATGIIPEFDSIDTGDRDAKDRLRDYFKRDGGGKIIEALWCAEGDYSWTYKTDIPHATFEIVEDGKPYCRGIVFALVDLA